MNTFLQDLRYGARMLAKSPGFTAITVLILALGIGANTAIFSVVNAVLLRPLAFNQADRLVAISGMDTRLNAKSHENRFSVSYPDFEDWRAQNQVFEKMAVYESNNFTFTNGREAVHVQGAVVSADLFPLLRAQPALGRIFLTKEDEPGNRVALLSHAIWQSRFGGDPSVLGRTVTLDAHDYEIVGVMPPAFQFPVQNEPVEIWTTIAIERNTEGGQPVTAQRGNHFLQAVARLKPGVSIEQAQANLDTISAALTKAHPDSNAHSGVAATPLLNDIVGNVQPALLILFGAAVCVLLVACVNVANLLIARSMKREREISIRAALGAGRGRIVRQLLTESVLLATLGGIAGMLLAIWGVESLASLLPANFPRINQLAPDGRVLGFTIAVSILIGCLAGIMPAWRASQPNLSASLNDAGRGSTEGARSLSLRSALVVVEIVLALVLLTAGGLLVQSFLRLQQVKPGFDPHNILTAKLLLPDAAYPKPIQAAAFYQKLLARVSTLPGVRSASGVWPMPLSGSEITLDFQIEERPVPEGQRPQTHFCVVALDYFRTMRIPLLKGRDFIPRDDTNSAAVAIVTESFAREFFPGQDVIGKRITPAGSVDPNPAPVREIVGVVADMKFLGLRSAAKPEVYVPHPQFAIGGLSVIARTENDPMTLLPALRSAVGEFDKDVPVYNPKTMEQYLASSVAQPRLNAMLVGLFSAVALVLSAAGIYGVMSYSVTQRTQEIGIRLALGAQRRDVLRLIVGQGVKLIAIGVIVGLIVAFLATRLLAGLLYGVETTDLPTITGVALLLALVAVLACWLPARRASALDPMIALREG
ncbi:MAG TPA: ABC transporter permease [Chthoniobacterales bacterium]